MAQGYEDTRFENTVDRHFHCPICLHVLRDPVQCRQNQHYFCTRCITKHLQENSPTCPTCVEELTIETLGRPARILTDVLSTFKISCDHAERGCREMVELEALKTHVASCDFGPVVCSNGECMEVVNKREKEVHESKTCEFRIVKCVYCGEEIEFVKMKSHRCPTRKEIDEMKMNLSEVKEKLNQLCSAQEEMANEMKSTMSDIKESVTTIKQAMTKESVTTIKQAMTAMQSPCHVCGHPSNVVEDIVIAGGISRISVEIFSWTNETWTRLGEMNECRSLATSFVYENQMTVTGGFVDRRKEKNTCTVEKLDLTHKDGEWNDCPVKLPSKCRGHKTVLDQNRLIVIGGIDDKDSSSNAISEVSLTHPYSSKLLTHMPLARYFHGAEHIDGKIYILGGHTDSITNTVLMYDPITNKCNEMPPLPFPVSTMATVSWKYNVIVMGGKDTDNIALNTVILYNVNTGKSTMLPEMKKRRKGSTAVMTGNKIVVMGGQDEKRINLKSVECYSFDTKTWEDLPSMNEKRLYATSVVKPACL